LKKCTNNKKKSDRGLKQKKHSVLQWNDQHKFSWLAPVFWMKFLFIFTVCPSRIVKWRKRRERERWRKKIIICWMGKKCASHISYHVFLFSSESTNYIPQFLSPRLVFFVFQLVLLFGALCAPSIKWLYNVNDFL